MNNHRSRGINMLLSSLLFLTVCALLPSIVVASTHATPGKLVTAPRNLQGCGRPAPIAPGTSKLEFINSGGLKRSYLLYLPPDYRGTTHYPLVLDFHGYGSNPFMQANVSSFTLLARQQSFIVAYPWGAIGPNNHTGWATGLPGRAHVNDVLFVSDLLRHLQATVCINLQRIFATGFSNGGGMTNVLACKLAGRIAAFAPVSGSYPPVPGGCSPLQPVSILEFHGTADPIVPYLGSLRKKEPPIMLWLQQWASRDGCTQGPNRFYRSPNVIGEAWTGCKNGVVVIGYRILGEGHQWPHILFKLRTGKTWVAYTATQLIWSFFQSHPLRG
jgi:polyhydroxybutyrate depolymerase